MEGRTNNTAQVTAGTSETRNNTVGIWMNVRHIGKVHSVTTLKEESHTSNESKHSAVIARINFSNDDEEDTGHDTVSVEQNTLGPNGFGFLERDISCNATEGSEDNVQQTEHSSPVTTILETETREVAGIIVSENAVDGQLGTEGAEVMSSGDHGLRGGDDFEDLFESWLLDNFALGGLNHLLSTNVGLVVGVVFVVIANRLLLHAARIGIASSADLAWNGNDTSVDVVFLESSISVSLTIGPFSSWAIVAEEDKSSSGGDDQDTRDDEGDAPGNMCSKTITDERVEDSGHDEVSDS